MIGLHPPVAHDPVHGNEDWAEEILWSFDLCIACKPAQYWGMAVSTDCSSVFPPAKERDLPLHCFILLLSLEWSTTPMLELVFPNPIDSPRYKNEAVIKVIPKADLIALMDCRSVLQLKVRLDFWWFIHWRASPPYFSRMLLTLVALWLSWFTCNYNFQLLLNIDLF